ncbi:MAG TPA: tetratricopeptide repeat protein, partial [Gemmatimonadales bacterium]|nr:tetratricopeptide repeat protein [Gemmatimonadales bacterium]
ASKRNAVWRHWAEGALAMAEGRPRDALAAFRAVEAHPRAWCRNCAAFQQALAFDALGEPDSALSHFERGIRSPEFARARSDEIGLATALRRAGELAEQKGDRTRAREYYTQFLDLWRDADTDLQPVVRDVRGRLAQLTGEPKP